MHYSAAATASRSRSWDAASVARTSARERHAGWDEGIKGMKAGGRGCCNPGEGYGKRARKHHARRDADLRRRLLKGCERATGARGETGPARLQAGPIAAGSASVMRCSRRPGSRAEHGLTAPRPGGEPARVGARPTPRCRSARRRRRGGGIERARSQPLSSMGRARASSAWELAAPAPGEDAGHRQ